MVRSTVKLLTLAILGCLIVRPGLPPWDVCWTAGGDLCPDLKPESCCEPGSPVGSAGSATPVPAGASRPGRSPRPGKPPSPDGDPRRGTGGPAVPDGDDCPGCTDLQLQPAREEGRNLLRSLLAASTGDPVATRPHPIPRRRSALIAPGMDRLDRPPDPGSGPGTRPLRC